jgi:hypothetical protein
MTDLTTFDRLKGAALIGTFIGVLTIFAMWVSLWEMCGKPQSNPPVATNATPALAFMDQPTRLLEARGPLRLVRISEFRTCSAQSRFDT